MLQDTGPIERRGWLCKHPVLQGLGFVGLLVYLALTLLGTALAQADESWDKQFDEPLYLVHITETSTLRGPEKRDFYMLHPQGPDENGVILTADGYGGFFINKGEIAGGRYNTPRQVCDNVKAIPPEKLNLGFDCRRLYALTDCAEICKKTFAHGTSDGESEYPDCTCICELGYEYLERVDGYQCVPCQQVCQERTDDAHSVYDPAESAPNVCACKCETGYDDRDSEKCEKIDCPGRAKSMADLRAASAFFQCPAHRTLNRHCCCDEGALPWGGVCQNEVDIPPERRQWGAVTEQFVNRGVLTQTLNTKGYTRRVLSPGSYQPASYPPGTVVFWAVQGTDASNRQVTNLDAHSSVIVNSAGDQMEMGAAEVSVFRAGDPPNPPKTNLKNATYTAYEVWLPPAGAKVKPGAGRLMQMPRGAIPKQNENEIQKWKWNCHGFVKAVAETYVAVPDPGAKLPPQLQQKNATQVPMKDPPGVPFTLELQGGALYGRDLALDLFLPGGFVEFTDEFLVQVGDDGSAEIYVFGGQANYFTGGDGTMAGHGTGTMAGHGTGTMVHVPPDQMLTVRDGIASEPGGFAAGSLDRWWQGGGAFEVGGLTIDLGSLAVAALLGLLAVLAVGFLVVWQLSRRRRPAPTAAPPSSVARLPEPSGEAWGALSVIQGQATPAALSLDKPVMTIGRGAASDLVLLDSLISRRHAQVRREEGGQVILRDLASTNGTFVNGQRVTGSQPLLPGDVIRLGHTRLVFGSAARGFRLPTPRPLPRAAATRPSRVSLVLDRPVLTIGRSSACDLVLVDSGVSRRHAQIRREGGAAILYDLNSSNGTFVNGRRVTGFHPLRPGDVVRVGQTELVYGPDVARPRQASGGQLTLVQGTAQPSTLDLRHRGRLQVRIGRSRDNEVVVGNDPHVSRHHAQIHRTAQGHEIVDLGTGTGLYVNGQQVTHAPLSPGDRIRLGSTEFVYAD